MAYCNYSSGVQNGNTDVGGANTNTNNTCTSTWGTAGSDAVSYSISAVAIGQIINDAHFNDIGVKVNSERSRRGHSNRSYSFSGVVYASHLNDLKNGIQDAGYTSGFSGVSAGNRIYASNINDMITKVKDAGNICLCNCNYCTCNCNYCTCNCNYSCTCNCNY